MPDYLGPLGGLVPIPTASEISVARESRYRISTTVENLTRAQIRSAPQPRKWEVSHLLVTPGQFDVLEAFALGLYGHGPFFYVGADARALSVLTPAQSALRNVGPEFAPAGPVMLSGRSYPVSLTASIPSSWRGLVDAPVVPGVPVTASIWVQSATGAPIISVGWVVGGNIPETLSVTGSSGGMWQRLTWTGTPPAGAAQLRLGVRSSVTAVAGPQVTWTPGPVPYAMGRGADSVIVESTAMTPTILVPGASYASASYTIREVGYAGW